MSLLERLEVTRHPKRQADVSMLLNEIRHSPFIGEISVKEIEHLLHADALLFFYDGDILAGLAGWDVIGKTWVELGPFYTAKAYRGQGLGNHMFDTVEEIQHGAGRTLYAVTKNPVVKQMFAKRGFRTIRTWTLPFKVQLHLMRKLTLRKLLRHVRKLRLGDSVSHFIKT